MTSRVFSFMLSAFLGVSCAEPRTVDVLILGGTVIDGSGGRGRRVAVGVEGDSIVFVGSARNVTASDTIDASGLVVAPGFIDVHSHTVEGMLENPSLRLNEGVVRQGVTTVVGGPDGGASPNVLRQALGALEEMGVGTNLAFYVGHNGIREDVMGQEQRAPTDDELEQMKAMVREGMDMGAVGLSTGLMYPPGMYSETDEVVALAKEVASYEGIYDSHVRDPAFNWLESNQEAIEIGRRAGIPAKLGHIKAVGLQNSGKAGDVVRMVEEARKKGETVVSDQYPYDGAATATLRDVIVVPPDLAGPSFDLNAALRNPAIRSRIQEASENGIDGGFAWLKATGYTSQRIIYSDDYPQYVGMYLAEVARQREVDGFDAIADLILTSDAPIGITLGGIREEEVREIMVQPWNMIASDGAASDGVTPRGHPRSTGTFPRLLGWYVREQEVLSLQEAIRKITQLPAEYLGLTNRGRIDEGFAADIAIFDPETIIDRSTWTEPHHFAEGVQHVMVGGVFVLRHGVMTQAAPGKVVRPRRTARN